MSLSKLTILFRGIAFAIDTMISTVLSISVVELLTGESSMNNNAFIIFLGLSLLILRDLFGKSIGKYLLGLNIVDANSNTKAKWYQRLLKNVTVSLSIIEIFMVLLRKDHKRIGDMIVKTETKLNENSYALSLFQHFIK